MKKSIALILVITLLMTLTACTTKIKSEAVKGEESRMVIIEERMTFAIVYDKETKVMYAVSNGPNNGGTFTLLVDASGNPLLYQGK